MFGMWDVLDVGCRMWDFDLQNFDLPVSRSVLSDGRITFKAESFP